MAPAQTIAQRNLDCVFNILGAARDTSDRGSDDIRRELIAVIDNNIVHGVRFVPVMKNVLTLRVRFFDVGGGVEEITFDRAKGGAHLLPKNKTPRYSTVDDRTVASLFNPEFRRPGVGDPRKIKGLVAKLDVAKDEKWKTNSAPTPKGFMSFDLSTTLIKSGDDGWPAEKWRNYLRNGILLREEHCPDPFPVSEIRDVWMEALKRAGKRKRLEYAYLVPVVAWDRLVCVVTFRSAVAMHLDFLEQLPEALHVFGKVTGVLSAYMAPRRSLRNRQDLELPYFQTQSSRLWEHGKGKHKKPYYVVNCVRTSESGGLADMKTPLAEMLTRVQYKLMVDIRTPVGESAIAQVILDRFALPCLNKFYFDPKTGASLIQQSDDLCKMLALAAEGEEKLREIPQYRQHFIHSFHVCITGLRLLFEGTFGATGKRRNLAEHLADQMNIDEGSLVRAWLLASLYHDVAYVVTSVHEWVGTYLGRVMMADGVDSNTGLVANDLAKFVRHGEYPYALDTLADCLRRFSATAAKNVAKAKCLRLVLQGIMGKTSGAHAKLDHGIVSALMFLNSAPRHTSNEKVFLLAADAIACHDALWQNTDAREAGVMPHKATQTKPQHSRNYLRDLLIICDSIQQWGRSESEETQRLFHIGLDDWASHDNGMWEVGLKYRFLSGKENDGTAITSMEKFAENWPKVVATMGDAENYVFLPKSKISVCYEFDRPQIPLKLTESGGLWEGMDFGKRTWSFGDGAGSK